MGEKIIETLEGGLHTRRHPGLLPEGALTVARDTEYRPDDPSPRVAAGRAQCGQSPTTNASLASPITALTAVAWPPGTKADADDSAENLKQFLYFRSGAPNGTALLAVPVSDDPGDAAFDSERAHTLYATAAIPIGIPSGFMDVAFTAGEFFLFPGTQNYALSRGSAGNNQELSFHGVARNDVPLWTVLASGVGAAGAAAGYVNYWFTWVDGEASPRREGTFLAPELNSTGYNGNTGGETWVRITDAIAAGNSRVTLTANKAEFDAARPANATGIYIYRTKAYDADRANSVNAAPTYLAWPQGWRITDSLSRTLIPITSLTTTLGPDGSVHYSLCLDEWAITDAALDVSAAAPIFEVITVNDVPDGRDGAPPVSTTGDAFEESIVCNDVEDATLVRFSYPGLPHSFPSLFYLRMSPPEGDEVVAIRALGTRLFVGMRENVYRINWLPRESETDFSRGRVVDRVARRGTFGPQAVALFEMPGIGPLLAYVSRDGVYMTDLDENRKMTGALDWEAMIPNPGSCLLRNDIDKERLVLAYDSGVGFRDALLYITYSEGKVRITGPIRRPGGIAAICEASTNGGSRIIASTDLSGTRLFYEDMGTQDDSGSTPMEMLVRSREIYPLALGEEATLGRVFAHGDGDGSLSVTAFGMGNGKTLSARTKTGLVNIEPLLTGQKLGLCERVAFEVSATQTVRVNAVGVFWDPLGEIER